MATDYKISTEFTAKDRLTSRLNRMSRAMTILKRGTDRVGRAFKSAARVASFFGGVIKSVAKIGAIGIGLLVGAVWKLSSAFSMVEDAEASFTPLLGSVSRATELVDALNKTAATTPFQFETLADTAKQLLPSMNGNIENTIALTRMLGDTAGGNAQKMESITRGYNKTLIKGKVDMESLNMIAEAGVPIYQELAKELGISGNKLFSQMRKGKISVEDLNNTFKRMTSEGGIFYKGMEIASKTLTGRISTFKDTVIIAMAKIGKAMSPVLKDITDKLITVAESISAWATANQELIKQKTKEYFNKIKQGIQWIIDNKEKFYSFFKQVKEFGKTLLNVAQFAWRNKEAFIAVAIAIKSVSTSLSMLSFAGAVGGADKLSGAIGGATTRTQKLAGMLGKGGLLFSSFSAGWAVGSFIWDQWLEKSEEVANKIQNTAIKIQLDAKNMTESEIDKKLKENARQRKELLSPTNLIKNTFSGGLGKINEADAENKRARRVLLEQKLARLQSYFNPVAKGGNFMDTADTSMQSGINTTPQAQGGNFNTKETKETIVTIRDETGRAEVTKGEGVNGLPTQRTGGMRGTN